MAKREEVTAVRNVLLTVGREMEEKGGGSEKLKSFAALVNSYTRLLGATRPSSKSKFDPFQDGDPGFHQSLLEE